MVSHGYHSPTYKRQSFNTFLRGSFKNRSASGGRVATNLVNRGFNGLHRSPVVPTQAHLKSLVRCGRILSVPQHLFLRHPPICTPGRLATILEGTAKPILGSLVLTLSTIQRMVIRSILYSYMVLEALVDGHGRKMRTQNYSGL